MCWSEIERTSKQRGREDLLQLMEADSPASVLSEPIDSHTVPEMGRWHCVRFLS